MAHGFHGSLSSYQRVVVTLIMNEKKLDIKRLHCYKNEHSAEIPRKSGDYKKRHTLW
jgi:hypothetical protein